MDFAWMASNSVRTALLESNLLSSQGLHWFCWVGSRSSCRCRSLLTWLCHPWGQVQPSDSFRFIDSVQDWQMGKVWRDPRSLHSLCLSRISHPRLWVPCLQRGLPGFDKQRWWWRSICQSSCKYTGDKTQLIFHILLELGIPIWLFCLV